ncbi:hypothetical protein [Bacillus sp. FJAT-44742]|uniref:hypothetical protein n=1 Tax=Bacillus sp. FJAT-44742 TaxID=2014005 RepID=UPI001E4BC863|nr:hypothetical protein [Bacillus sp. FJAT-44742]
MNWKWYRLINWFLKTTYSGKLKPQLIFPIYMTKSSPAYDSHSAEHKEDRQPPHSQLRGVFVLLEQIKWLKDDISPKHGEPTL